MKFNLSHYGYLYGDKDMFLNALDSHVVNDREEGRGACSYFVFYSEAAGNIIFFWWKDFMKDFVRRLRSDRVLLHVTEFQFRDKLCHQFFRAKIFAIRWGFHMIPVNMRLVMDYTANELNEPALVWPAIPLVGKHCEIEEAEQHDGVGRPV